MTYANQFAYDHATEQSLSDYQDEPAFAEFTEHVTLELLSGSDYQGINAQIFMIDLKLATGGYMMALEWVCGRLTEDQYRAWIDDYGCELN